MEFLKCPVSGCHAEVHMFRELSGTDRSEGVMKDGKYHIAEWKDTGYYEVIQEYWECENGHVRDIDVEVVE